MARTYWEAASPSKPFRLTTNTPFKAMPSRRPSVKARKFPCPWKTPLPTWQSSKPYSVLRTRGVGKPRGFSAIVGAGAPPTLGKRAGLRRRNLNVLPVREEGRNRSRRRVKGQQHQRSDSVDEQAKPHTYTNTS